MIFSGLNSSTGSCQTLKDSSERPSSGYCSDLSRKNYCIHIAVEVLAAVSTWGSQENILENTAETELQDVAELVFAGKVFQGSLVLMAPPGSC